MISIKINEKDILKAKKLLSAVPESFNQAQKHAIIRTLESMKTVAVRKAAELYYIKPSAVRKTFKMDKANLALISRGKRMSIVNYKFQPLRARAKNYMGAVKAGGLKSFPKAFILRLGAAGKKYPFKRVGRGRWDIEAITSPAVPQILKNPEIVAEIQEHGADVFAQRLNHEVMRALGVFAK